MDIILWLGVTMRVYIKGSQHWKVENHCYRGAFKHCFGPERGMDCDVETFLSDGTVNR